MSLVHLSRWEEGERKGGLWKKKKKVESELFNLRNSSKVEEGW
jgi:hypothetical protein